MKTIDFSHTIEHGMITYRGLPAPMICDYLSREASRDFYAEGTESQIGRIDLVANTGTYMDSPFHRYANGKDLAALPLDPMAGLPGVVVRPDGMRVTKDAFAGIEVAGKAMLIETGRERHWRTDDYFEGHPFLSEDAARFLRENDARLVGIDSYNIDDTCGRSRPVHSLLLGAEEIGLPGGRSLGGTHSRLHLPHPLAVFRRGHPNAFTEMLGEAARINEAAKPRDLRGILRRPVRHALAIRPQLDPLFLIDVGPCH